MRRCLAIPVAAALLICHPAWATESLTLVTEDEPPLNMAIPGGGIGGTSTARLIDAMDKAGIGYTLALFPWVRAENMALSQPETCVYSAARTPEREDRFKWIGPIGVSVWTLFGRSEGPFPKTLKEAQGGLIGGYVGDSATAYLKQRGFRVTEAREGRLNLKKLRAGRIDYWVDGLQSGLYRIREAGITDIVPVLKFKNSPLYLACNSSVSDHAVEQLNRILWQTADEGEPGLAAQP